MHIPDRAYGVETEHGCLLKSVTKGILHMNEWPDNFLEMYIRTHPDKACILVLPGGRAWHRNGSLTYIDRGNHPEHSTAETRSVRDAVIWLKAGERLTQEIFSRPCRIQGDELHIQLFKNNLSRDEKGISTTFGCHENYLSYVSWLVTGDKHSAFVPFLVTRQIFDGAGGWDKDGAFFLSQRAIFLGKGSNAGSRMDYRFPVGLKDVNTTPRLHLVSGDSNILEYASWLKLGTTSLVISLIEAGRAPSLACRYPLISLEEVARSGATAPVVYLETTAAATACDIQAQYLEAVRRELAFATFDSEETEAECKMIVRAWEAALNAVYANDISWMLGRLDWATKKWLADRLLLRIKNLGACAAHKMRMDFDIYYHAASDRSLQEMMNARWPSARIATDQEIARAMIEPPSGTRASIRSEFIRSMLGRDLTHIRPYIYWHKIEVEGKEMFDQQIVDRFPMHRFPMPHPLVFSSKDFEIFLQGVLAPLEAVISE